MQKEKGMWGDPKRRGEEQSKDRRNNVDPAEENGPEQSPLV